MYRLIASLSFGICGDHDSFVLTPDRTRRPRSSRSHSNDAPTNFEYRTATTSQDGVDLHDKFASILRTIPGCECSECCVLSPNPAPAKTAPGHECPCMRPGATGVDIARLAAQPAASCTLSSILTAESPIWQCSKLCKCPPDCPARLTGAGVRQKLELRHHDQPKSTSGAPVATPGWGCFASDGIRKGSYICEYVGVLVTSAEADRRLRCYDEDGTGHALLVLREMLPDGTVMR